MRKLFIPIALLGLMGCTNDTVTLGTVDTTSVVQAKFASSVTVSVSGNNLVIKSNGLPNHKTPYWGVGNALYEPFPAGHAPNANTTMSEQNYSMTIPAKPNEASTHEETSLGVIGLALNGVPIYNNNEGGNVALDPVTLTTLDAAGAHPAPSEDYHYHVTGIYTTMDDSSLVGFLRDGYPIYGRKDMNGAYPTDLDDYNGHTSATTEFPNGIYHYHTRNENYLNTGYYILKSGKYYGTKGKLTM